MYADLREWLTALEEAGELRHVRVPVDWRGEIAELQRRLMLRQGPATLYENIKDYQTGRCTRLFCGGIGTPGRIALMLGMPSDSPRAAVIAELRRRLRQPLTPETVKSGPVKQNILTGDQIDLFEFPVPQWHPLDQGRYINTWCGVVTRDPETGRHNIGAYRAVIGGKDKINVFMVPAQNWGIHYAQYQALGQPMPVAFVYGFEPTLMAAAGIPFSGDEYEIMGGLRQTSVPLVKCETSEIMVPAAAEIVIEGLISTDPKTYEIEGPYGESTGRYSRTGLRPVMQVSRITHRDDPIFRGAINEAGPLYGLLGAAQMWNLLEDQQLPGILDVSAGLVTAVRIHKTYQGQARHIAAAIWGSRMSVTMGRFVVVVDDENDVDIANPAQLLAAMTRFMEPSRGVHVFKMELSAPTELGLSFEEQDEMEYGQALGSKLLIDATLDWTAHPRRPEWHHKRLPPSCFEPLPEVDQTVTQRWADYGVD